MAAGKQVPSHKAQRQGCLGCLGIIVAIVVIAAVLSSGSSSGTSPTQRRAAFKTFASLLMGAMNQCDKASKTAQASFQAAANGGDTLTAYQDAGSAHDACDNAGTSISQLSVPGAIADDTYHLDDARLDYLTSASDRTSMWEHVQALLQNPNDLASQSGTLTDAKNANQLETLGSTWIVETAMTLTVPIQKITPVVPTPIGG